MSEHYITKCKNCGVTISQCRCPSEGKNVNYALCNDCSIVHTCPVCKKLIECSRDHCNYSIIFKSCLDCLAKKQ